MSQVSDHKMRFYRRNFKRMYPDVVARMERRQRLQLALRGAAYVTVAAAAAIGAAAGLIWALR